MKEPEYCEALEKTLDVSEVVLTKAPQAAQDTFKNLKLRTAEFWHLGAKTASKDPKASKRANTKRANKARLPPKREHTSTAKRL